MALKVYFAPDTSDHMNWGCRLMGGWFRSALKEAGAEVIARTGSRWFFQNDPAIPAPFTWKELLEIAAKVRAGELLQDVARALSACDLVVINAENFIRPGTLKGRRLLMVVYLAKAVFGRHCIITNATLDLAEPALREMAANVLPLMDELHVRESVSKTFGEAIGVANVSVIPDVAWTVPATMRDAWLPLAMREGHFDAWPDSAEGFDPSRPYVSVCASSLYSQPQHARLDQVPAFVRLCQALATEVAPVVLAAPCEVDSHILRKVRAQTGLPLLGNGLPVRQAIDVLGNASVHVGGRWHLGIFASTGGTPLVGLTANTHKMDGLYQQLGMREPLFDALDLERQVDGIVAAARARIEGGAALRQSILARSRELAAQVPSNLATVRRLVAETT